MQQDPERLELAERAAAELLDAEEEAALKQQQSLKKAARKRAKKMARSAFKAPFFLPNYTENAVPNSILRKQK